MGNRPGNSKQKGRRTITAANVHCLHDTYRDFWAATTTPLLFTYIRPRYAQSGSASIIHVSKKKKQQNRHKHRSRNWQQTSELHTRRPGNNHSGKGMLCCHGCVRTQKFGKGTAVLPAFWGMPVEFCSCCEESMSTNPGSNQKRSYGTTKCM